MFKDWVGAKERWLKNRVEMEARITERLALEETEAPLTKREKLKRLEKPKEYEESSSPKELIPIKATPRDLSEEERIKYHKLKKKSSLGLKYPISLCPAPNIDSIATSRYDKLRSEHVTNMSINY